MFKGTNGFPFKDMTIVGSKYYFFTEKENLVNPIIQIIPPSTST